MTFQLSPAVRWLEQNYRWSMELRPGDETMVAGYLYARCHIAPIFKIKNDARCADRHDEPDVYGMCGWDRDSFASSTRNSVYVEMLREQFGADSIADTDETWRLAKL